MIQDMLLELADAQVVTVTAPSTNVVDQRAAGQAIGKECWLEIRVDTTATAAGAATVVFALETDSAVGFGTKTTLAQSEAIGKATLLGDTIAWRIRVPSGAKQYLRAYFTVATGPLTAGKFDAHFILDTQILP